MTAIEASAPRTLAAADLSPRGAVHPSPADWRDEVFYFLLPDRFSDGREAQRPRFDRDHPEAHRAPSKAAWMAGGKSFQGGTIAGIRGQLPYLAGLGVTTIWLGPVWRQRIELDTYHGYGIQHFLDVDPRFGSRQELRDLVDAAHALDIRVILDVIVNHSGNNFFYRDEQGHAVTTRPYRFAPPHDFGGWRDAHGQPALQFGTDDDGPMPEELRNLEWYTRAGQIGDFESESGPLDANAEFRRGDFFDLKDLDLGRHDVLAALIRIYQYWIALTDCDGFRVDTVKHISFEASRNFCNAVHEYSESIGKDNFFIVAEITGGASMERDYLDVFGRNIDAILDLNDPARRRERFVKGFAGAPELFEIYTGHDAIGSHRETGRYHLSILDDHDMVGRGKRRFAAGNGSAARFAQVAHATGTQLTMLGMPCIYYGTEQAFDGTVDRHDGAIEQRNGDGSVPFEDRYIRESMFGGSFGAFETAGCHFFDAANPAYLRIAAIARVRNGKNLAGLALRRGRQYPREIDAGEGWRDARGGEVAAWSRILNDTEVLVALNTNGGAAREARITVDRSLHPPGSRFAVAYRGDRSDAELANPPAGEHVTVEDDHGRSFVRVQLPPAGMMILVPA
jgi:glycosidase